MANLSKLELKAMDSIAYNEMNPLNGSRPESADDVCCWLWVDEIARDLGVSIPVAKGVVGSLAAKGFIVVAEYEGAESNQVDFSKEGYRVWDELSERRG